MNKERIIRLLYKYGLQLGMAFAAFVILVLIIFFLVRRSRRLRKKREEESRIDLRDLFRMD